MRSESERETQRERQKYDLPLNRSKNYSVCFKNVRGQLGYNCMTHHKLTCSLIWIRVKIISHFCKAITQPYKNGQVRGVIPLLEYFYSTCSLLYSRKLALLHVNFGHIFYVYPAIKHQQFSFCFSSYKPISCENINVHHAE